MNQVEQGLIEKLKQLPRERIAEVENFIDFLRSREQERALTRAATRAAEKSFAQVWKNDDDAEYDRL